MKILMGKRDEVCRGLLSVDVWGQKFRTMNMQGALDAGNCPCCKQGQYEFLDGRRASATTALCGRNAVQILPPANVTTIDFKHVAARLPSAAKPIVNQFMLRFAIEPYHVTLFADGRAIVQGTVDVAAARSIYAKYVGG